MQLVVLMACGCVHHAWIQDSWRARLGKTALPVHAKKSKAGADRVNGPPWDLRDGRAAFKRPLSPSQRNGSCRRAQEVRAIDRALVLDELSCAADRHDS